MAFRTGDRGEAVRNLQKMLVDMGADLRPDGEFGRRTHEAVQAIQRKLKLRDDGVVGPGTLDAIIGRPLPQMGQRGPRVRALQLKLGIEADGVYGQGTAAAVRRGGGAAAGQPMAPKAAVPRVDVRLSPNFTLGELVASPTADRLNIDNWPVDPVIPARLTGLCTHILEPLTRRFGRITVNSGYRNIATNRAVGSKSDRSNHVQGYAADIEVPTMDNRSLARWIRDNMEYRELLLEFHHVGAPSSGWVHVAYAIDADNKKKTGTINSSGYKVGID